MLSLPALQGEHLAGADRIGFADTPLGRATKAWLSEQVEDLAEAIRTVKAAEYKPADHEKATDALEKMRNLMRRYLDATGVDGRGGPGEGEGVDGPFPPPPPPPIWGSRV